MPDSIEVDNLGEFADQITKAVNAIKIPETVVDLNPVIKEVKKVTEAIESIRFPVSGGGSGSSESTLAFPLYANITTTIAGDVITQTDGTKTLTTTINGNEITEVWS
jgi:hypothetical protein